MAQHTLLDIQNKRGLHARAASAFVKQADQFTCEIWVEKDGQRVSGRSIMGLMMLAAAFGSVIKVIADGADETPAMEALKTLVNNKFGEDE